MYSDLFRLHFKDRTVRMRGGGETSWLLFAGALAFDGKS